MVVGQDSGCGTSREGNGGRGRDTHSEKVEWRWDRIPDVSHPDKGMVAGQDSPPGGMSYAAHRKGGLSACARERERASWHSLGRIPQVGEGLERNGFGGMVKGVYTWVW